MGEHDGEPISQEIKDCIEGGYAQGRADERAAVVAWLRKRDTEYGVADDCADDIERGEHVDAAKGEP